MASACWNVPGLAEQVGDVRRAAVEFAREEGVPDPPLADLRLALSEAVSNAVLHAFRAQSRPGTVTVSIAVTSDESIEAVVRDDGMGMTSRSDSPGLGLGLGLISSVADAVEHRSHTDGGGFELWMCFRFGAA